MSKEPLVVKKVVMVSRRKILSRSRDDLNTEQPAMQEEEEDVWYQRDKLYKVRSRIRASSGNLFYRMECKLSRKCKVLSSGVST